MDIRVKESMFIKVGGMEYTVRAGTVGVEKNRILFFHDVTKTTAVGFPREACLENNHLFSISKTLSDREVSIKEVLSIVEGISDPEIRNNLIENIKAL